MCVLIYIWINPKRFLIILYVFGSDFCHPLCSCLVLTLFFIVLNMFCVEKKRCQSFSRLTRESRNWKNAFSSHFLVLWQRGSRLTNEWALKPSKRLQKFHENCFRDSSHNSPSHETPRNSLLKCFSWETCFKPLPSSLKPLFQYFYIKTQSIWMVFHSINISKVILNSFHWFWSLNFVLDSFVLLVEAFIIGIGKI